MSEKQFTQETSILSSRVLKKTSTLVFKILKNNKYNNVYNENKIVFEYKLSLSSFKDKTNHFNYKY